MKQTIIQLFNLTTWLVAITGVILLICGYVNGLLLVLISISSSWFMSVHIDKTLPNPLLEPTTVATLPPHPFGEIIEVFGFKARVCQHLWLTPSLCCGLELEVMIEDRHRYFRVSWPQCQPLDSTQATRIRMICNALELPKPHFTPEDDDNSNT